MKKHLKVICGLLILIVFVGIAASVSLKQHMEEHESSPHQGLSSSASEMSGTESSGNSGEESSASEPSSSQGASSQDPEEDAPFDFHTKDLDGNDCRMSQFRDQKLIMIYYWEPWCEPCIGELGYLEKLYETYQADGFMLLSVITSERQEAEIRRLMAENGVTFPVLRWHGTLARLDTEFLPSAGFVDGDGRILLPESLAGARSYEEWEEIVRYFLFGEEPTSA